MKKLQNFVYKFIFLLFLLILFIFICSMSYSKAVFKNISDSFLRLHIVANSNSTEDQMLKYQIRDNVIEYITPYFENIKTKKEAIAVLENHLAEITELSSKIVEDSRIQLQSFS